MFLAGNFYRGGFTGQTAISTYNFLWCTIYGDWQVGVVKDDF
jgi:hypothetical protein